MSRHQVQEGSVSVLLHTVGSQRARVCAQTLIDDPALNVWMKTVLNKDLQHGREGEVQVTHQTVKRGDNIIVI